MTTKDDSRQSKAGVICDTDAVSGECSPAEGAVGRRAFALLGRLMAPYRPLAVAALVTLLLDTIGTLYVPTELSALLNSAIGAQGMGPLWDHALRMLVAAVVGSGSCVASYFLAARLAADVGRDLRVSVYRKSLELSASDFERFGTGSMITRTMGDANVVQQTIVMCFVMILPVPVIAVTSVVLAWGIDPAMGQVLVAIAVAMTVVSLVAIRRSAPIFLHLQEFVDRMNVRLRETITGARVIRAFGRERRERRRLDEAFEAYAENAVRVNLIFSVADCTTFFLMNVVEVLFVWLGADRVGVHAMQIGSISALVQFAIILLFFMMMAQFAMLQVPRALACLTRATELLELEPSIKDSVREAPAPPVEELLANERESPVAEFDHVDFRFDDAACRYLADKSCNGQSGARDLRNLIRKEVEDKITEQGHPSRPELCGSKGRDLRHHRQHRLGQVDDREDASALSRRNRWRAKGRWARRARPQSGGPAVPHGVCAPDGLALLGDHRLEPADGRA